MRLYLTLLAGKTSTQALPILATADPVIIHATINGLYQRIREYDGPSDPALVTAAATIRMHRADGEKNP